MRYTLQQYSNSLLSALSNKGEDEIKDVLRRFLSLLARAADRKHLGRVLQEVERRYYRDAGLRRVWIESANPVSRKTLEEIKNFFGKKAIIASRVKPELLAGIKTIVDDEILVDASARSLVRKLFS